MKIKLVDIKKGDLVYCTGDSGFCDSETEKVTKVTILYDEDNGKPYNVIWLGDRKFDSRNGGAMNPPTAYYIIPTEQKKKK
ncbi:MAG: hypothetical protein IPJ01_10090 [Micavibrio sp.]|nr:hypothetical protein [Micavibrio sp.]